jgi:hypothetical protein
LYDGVGDTFGLIKRWTASKRRIPVTLLTARVPALRSESKSPPPDTKV